ncbi:hypothetical protein Fmac_005524 [Flemingia macrophylla]|uniref:UBA domain-containing protein n=1 Tax=Flemingia macrophylla TaxID=520843 RepID=A0ABD1N831_9FABA
MSAIPRATDCHSFPPRCPCATATFATAITSGPPPFSLSCPFTPHDLEADPHSRCDSYRDWPFTSPLTSPPSGVSPSFVIPLDKTLNLSTDHTIVPQTEAHETVLLGAQKQESKHVIYARQIRLCISFNLRFGLLMFSVTSCTVEVLLSIRFTDAVMVRVNFVSGSYILCCDSYGVKYVASSSAVLANSKVLDHFVGMGFSREMVSKVIQEYGEENEAKLLEELLTYTDIEKNISDSENDDTLRTLVKMGYKQEEALIAIERLVPPTHGYHDHDDPCSPSPSPVTPELAQEQSIIVRSEAVSCPGGSESTSVDLVDEERLRNKSWIAAADKILQLEQEVRQSRDEARQSREEARQSQEQN